MTIAKNMTGKAKNESPREQKYPQGYVVSESLISDFIGSLGIHDINTAAARLQAVADLTGRMLDNRIDQPEQSDLQLIKHLAGESRNRRYRQIMKAIIAAVEEGPRGINAAHLTASHAVEMAFRWTFDCFSALNQYRDKLRRMRGAVRSKSQSEAGMLLRQ